jgi:23S rRNA pseudouridine955/2504/2580 synthase
MREIPVSSEYGGVRLDRFVAKAERAAPKGAVEKWIRTGRVKVNGKRAKASSRLSEGDVVALHAGQGEGRAPSGPGPQKPFSVLYEDEELLFLDKPPGVLSHPDGSGRASLSESLPAYIPDSFGGLFRPSVASRLDFNTSGASYSAKTPAAQRRLSSEPAYKAYLALCCGMWPGESLLRGAAEKNSRENKVFSSSDGSLMETFARPLAYANGVSLLSASILSGKAHQIRFQLSQAGHPVLGDRKYAAGQSLALAREAGASRQMLHCAMVKITGKRPVLSPPPEDFWEAANRFALGEALREALGGLSGANGQDPWLPLKKPGQRA